MPRPIALQQQIRESLWTLRELRIAFRGPFVTPQENCIYVVGRRIVTANEVEALARQGVLNAETEPPCTLKAAARNAENGSR
jgi:hypothetical protein